MLVLYETHNGFQIYKTENDDLTSKLSLVAQSDSLTQLEQASTLLNISEGKVPDSLKQFLEKTVPHDERLLVVDKHLADSIRSLLPCKAEYNKEVVEMHRLIRSKLESSDVRGLAHSVSRSKLQFVPEKLDTMVIQAVKCLEELDRELNIYSMRLKEWYGWHFPELVRAVEDNKQYAETVLLVGDRRSCVFESLGLPEELRNQIAALSEISTGTEITENDLKRITDLCNQIVELFKYRVELEAYLKNRMLAVAPNLTCIVGENVGARLIAHASGLTNLAKLPSSSVQLLGAERALFKALKEGHSTPKYGHLYHASQVGQVSNELKGKVARMLAARTSIAVRVDAYGTETSPEQGAANRIALEKRIKALTTSSKGSKKKEAQNFKVHSKKPRHY